MLSRLRRLFGATQGAPPERKQARGILVFSSTSEVIAAQRVLERSGLTTAVKGPPPALRTGCDMVIEFPLVMALQVNNLLRENGISPLDSVAVEEGLLEPVSLYQVKDFGQWLMVRAANMKITVDKSTLVIVNVSGGGCPDVPFLAGLITGKHLMETPPPREHGHTLCGYALHLAFLELQRLCRG